LIVIFQFLQLTIQARGGFEIAEIGADEVKIAAERG